MVKIRTLVPLQHPTTGEQFAAGVEVDVADDVAADWRADGKVAAVETEEKPGNYSARTGREDVAGGKEEPPPKKK